MNNECKEHNWSHAGEGATCPECYRITMTPKNNPLLSVLTSDLHTPTIVYKSSCVQRAIDRCDRKNAGLDE